MHVVVVVVVVVVRNASTRHHNYRVTSAPPSRLSLRKQKCPVIDGIRQAQCPAVAVPAASCSRSGGRQRGNSSHQNGYGSSG